jgi:hypothetical protein
MLQKHNRYTVMRERGERRAMPAWTVLTLALIFGVSIGACNEGDEGDLHPDVGDADVGGNEGDPDGAGEGGVQDGESCSNNVEPPCAAGLLCVQDSPGYCSADYLGRCAAIPSDCASIPDEQLCACDGTPYRNACEARRAGVGGVLAACP